jgi:nucleoside-triphosphatase THEP1
MLGWAVVHGSKGSPKSSCLWQLTSELNARGCSVGGVIQEAVEQDGERLGFRACRVSGDGSVLLSRKGSAPQSSANPLNWQNFCSFSFDNEAFEVAHHWISQEAQELSIVVIDEVSKLEVAQGGYFHAIQQAFQLPTIVVLGVRSEQLFAVMDRFHLEEPIAAWDIADGDSARLTLVEALVQTAESFP